MPDNVPEPLPSPEVPSLSASPSGLRQLTVAEARVLFATQQQVEKKMLLTNDIRVLVGSIVVAVATAFAVFFAVRSDAQDIADAGVKTSSLKIEVVDQKAVATQEELARFQREADRRLTYVEASMYRQDRKLDALLSGFKIPNPAPAPPPAPRWSRARCAIPWCCRATFWTAKSWRKRTSRPPRP